MDIFYLLNMCQKHNLNFSLLKVKYFKWEAHLENGGVINNVVLLSHL